MTQMSEGREKGGRLKYCHVHGDDTKFLFLFFFMMFIFAIVKKTRKHRILNFSMSSPPLPGARACVYMCFCTSNLINICIRIQGGFCAKPSTDLLESKKVRNNIAVICIRACMYHALMWTVGREIEQVAQSQGNYSQVPLREKKKKKVHSFRLQASECTPCLWLLNQPPEWIVSYMCKYKRGHAWHL